MYCADRQGDRVLAVAPGGDTVVLSIPVDGAPAALALDPAANRLYVMCERGSCIVLFRGVPGVAEAGPAASRPRPAVAPNPARGRVRVEPAGPGDTAVELVDAGGRVRSRRIVAAGCSAVELDLGAVRPGVYFVRVGAGRGAASARLVVVR
ncbi:T9SS type A sorting domain-containing protein [candidate division WOR-3 bacterium]|nr:T9SS type A sorting domain-containing protein [candidate division WOR-3 bacterium]